MVMLSRSLFGCCYECVCSSGGCFILVVIVVVCFVFLANAVVG